MPFGERKFSCEDDEYFSVLEIKKNSFDTPQTIYLFDPVISMKELPNSNLAV